jgi:hypothetical protein
VNLLQADDHEPGFREFHKFLTDPSPSERKYQEAVEEMKAANCQYAQRQTSWIRNKFLPAVWASKAADGGKSAEAYLLDTTGLDYPFYPKLCDRRLIAELVPTEPKKWTSAVRNSAVSLTQGRMNNLFCRFAKADFTHIPGQPSSTVSHCLILSPFRLRQKQCFPFRRGL